MRTFTALLMVALTIGLTLPSSDAIGDQSATSMQREILPVAWSGSEGRALEAVVESGYCLGDERPTLQVKVTELPRSSRFPRGGVVLKAIVTRPAQAPGPEANEQQTGEKPVVAVCNGVGLRLKKHISLARPRSTRPVLEMLSDGSLKLAPTLP